MDATGFHSKEGRLEESLRATETFIANGDNLTVGKFIRLLIGAGCSSSGHLNLTFSSGGERVATSSEDLYEVVGELTFSKIKTDNGMGKSITFINRETPSTEFMTIRVARPEAWREKTAWMATYKTGMLKVSNMI